MSSNCNVIGAFLEPKKALKHAVEQINECTSRHLTFNIVECPINKSVKGGIVIYTVESFNVGLSKIFEINPIYSFGGIKKWVRDQHKAAKKS